MQKTRKTLLIAGLFLLVIFGLKLVLAATDSANILSVVSIGTKDKPGYAVYWQKNKGSAKVERKEGSSEWSQIATTDLYYYTDYTVKKGLDYTYRVTAGSTVLTATAGEELSGKPTISNIKIEGGATGKSESSVIVTFKTDRLARAQVLYGESQSYTSQTPLDEALNQSHTVLIEKLKPNTTYHFKLRTTDKAGTDSSESDDQTATTPKSPTDQNILEIIVAALRNAFAGFEKWFTS